MIAKLLPILAPIVMGAMGRMSKQKGMGAQDLSGYLTNERRQAEQRQPDAMSALGNLLDTNDDGQVIDDVMKIGGSLLSGFFKR
jgi:hypothetical protein